MPSQVLKKKSCNEKILSDYSFANIKYSSLDRAVLKREEFQGNRIPNNFSRRLKNNPHFLKLGKLQGCGNCLKNSISISL